MNNPRDTQFAGFAKLLFAEVEDMFANRDSAYDDCDDEREQKAINDICSVFAERAYNLVLHTLWRTTPAGGSTIREYKGLTVEEIANLIPDLTEWPKDGEA